MDGRARAAIGSAANGLSLVSESLGAGAGVRGRSQRSRDLLCSCSSRESARSNRAYHALRATTGLPASIRGPVARSHGRDVLISSACPASQYQQRRAAAGEQRTRCTRAGTVARGRNAVGAEQRFEASDVEWLDTAKKCRAKTAGGFLMVARSRASCGLGSEPSSPCARRHCGMLLDHA
jgi:hypothetical protein